MKKRINELLTRKGNLGAKILFSVIGFTSLVWFLVRVIPKPSRAAYPCQRAAFPVASAFLLWLGGVVGSISLLKKARSSFRQSKSLLASFLLVFALGMAAISFIWIRPGEVLAGVQESEPIEMAAATEDVVDDLPSRVAIIQSEQSSCYDITSGELEEMIREAVHLAGGLEAVVQDGDVVVLKPNLVGNNSAAESECNGKTTDFRVTEIVAKLVREINPTGKILVMEGSAFSEGSLALMEILGYGNLNYVDSLIAMEETGDWFDFKAADVDSVLLDPSLRMYPDELKPNLSPALYYHRQYLEADVLISIPVLKNHFRTGITGAVKNVGIGSTPGRLYGKGPDESSPLLRNPGVDHTVNNLHRFIHDYYAGRPVDFVIMDGLQGIENGPGGGSDIKKSQKNMRLILASKDAIAIDAIEGLIISHDPRKCNHLVMLHNNGFGMVDAARIEVRGIQVEDVRQGFVLGDGADGLESQFNLTACLPYKASHCRIDKDTLYLSIDRADYLARLTFRVDDQPLGKYVIGGFDQIRLPLDGIRLTDQKVEITYEDIYLNTRKEVLQLLSTPPGNMAGEANLHLYPNPAGEWLNLRMKGMQSGELTLTIRSMDGRTVMERRLYPGSASLVHREYIGTLSEGSYLVSLRDENGNAHRSRFLKLD